MDAFYDRQGDVGLVDGTRVRSHDTSNGLYVPFKSLVRLIDLVVAPEAEKAICAALQATSVRLPIKWHNYAVPGEPMTESNYPRPP